MGLRWHPSGARTGPNGLRTLDRKARADITGALGLGVLAICLIAFRDDVIGAPLLYRGGFLIVSIATALTIAAAVVPGSGVASILGLPLLRQVGLRSYAIYLWHWPVFMLMRPGIDVGIEGVELFAAVRFGLTLVLAEISYRLVERPVREERFFATLERVIVDAPRNLRTVARVAAAAAGVAMVAAVLVGFQGQWGVTVAAAEADTLEATEEEQESRRVEPSRSAAAPSFADLGETQIASRVASPEPPDRPVTGPGSQLGKAPARELGSSTAFSGLGDSVRLGAAGALEAVGVETLDAEVGRQWWNAADAAASMGRGGHVGEVVVLHLGHNGTLTPEMFDDVMQELAEAQRVVVVNVSVPRRWEGSVNEKLRAGVARWPRAVLLDWHAIADGRPDTFVSDGVHLSASGRQLYAEAIATAVAGGG